MSNVWKNCSIVFTHTWHLCNNSINNSHMIIRHVNIRSHHPTKQPINKRTYAVHTYPQSHHVSHHVLINKSVHARRLCRYSWERTHAMTFNTVCSLPRRFILLQASICNIQLIILFQYYYANTEGNNIFTFLLIR